MLRVVLQFSMCVHVMQYDRKDRIRDNTRSAPASHFPRIMTKIIIIFLHIVWAYVLFSFVFLFCLFCFVFVDSGSYLWLLHFGEGGGVFSSTISLLFVHWPSMCCTHTHTHWPSMCCTHTQEVWYQGGQLVSRTDRFHDMYGMSRTTILDQCPVRLCVFETFLRRIRSSAIPTRKQAKHFFSFLSPLSLFV